MFFTFKKHPLKSTAAECGSQFGFSQAVLMACSFISVFHFRNLQFSFFSLWSVFPAVGYWLLVIYSCKTVASLVFILGGLRPIQGSLTAVCAMFWKYWQHHFFVQHYWFYPFNRQEQIFIFVPECVHLLFGGESRSINAGLSLISFTIN